MLYIYIIYIYIYYIYIYMSVCLSVCMYVSIYPYIYISIYLYMKPLYETSCACCKNLWYQREESTNGRLERTK